MTRFEADRPHLPCRQIRLMAALALVEVGHDIIELTDTGDIDGVNAAGDLQRRVCLILVPDIGQPVPAIFKMHQQARFHQVNLVKIKTVVGELHRVGIDMNHALPVSGIVKGLRDDSTNR